MAMTRPLLERAAGRRKLPPHRRILYRAAVEWRAVA